MRRFGAAMACVAMLATAYPSAGHAQAPKPAPAPAAAPSTAAAPAAAATTPRPARAKSKAKKRSWTWADARVCLEFPTNLQIIRCAEKYRYTRVPT